MGFLDAVAVRLEASAMDIPASQLADVVYALSSLQVRDRTQLDNLCSALRPRVDELLEADLVRVTRGLMKLRHHHKDLLDSLAPVIDRVKFGIGPVSLTNIISAFSLFGGPSNEFFSSLLHAATSRMNRLPPASVQHILTALCRQQGCMEPEVLAASLERLCEHITNPAVAGQLTAVQALHSMSALAKLQYRDLPALSVLTSVLADCGNDVCWFWAPTAQFLMSKALLQTLPPDPRFNEARCHQVLQVELDSAHCVDIIQNLTWLDLHSTFTTHLFGALFSTLSPQLHDLRAKEVLAIARSISLCPVPDPAQDLCDWREQALENCLESLRRHEHFLESSWNTLLPLKLLCLEIETGVLATRRLAEVLNPRLYNFVDRLRSLTKVECEANRFRREGVEECIEEEEEVTQVSEGPLIIRHGHFQISIGCQVQDLPVDILFEGVSGPE